MPLRGGLWVYIIKSAIPGDGQLSECWPSTSFIRKTKVPEMEGFYHSYSLLHDCDGMMGVELHPDIPLSVSLALLDEVTPFVEDRFKVFSN